MIDALIQTWEREHRSAEYEMSKNYTAWCRRQWHHEGKATAKEWDKMLETAQLHLSLVHRLELAERTLDQLKGLAKLTS